MVHIHLKRSYTHLIQFMVVNGMSSAMNPLENAMKGAAIFSKQVQVFTYTVVYLRYVRDQSILNVLFPLLLISLTRFANNVEATYFDVETSEETGLTLKELLAKTIHVLQVLFVVQSLYAVVYHYFINLESDVCRWVYGYLFTDILGEFDCSLRGKTVLFVLDVIVLLCQLQVTTDRLTRLDNGRPVNLQVFPLRKYGILSILRTSTTGLQTEDWELTISAPLRSSDSGVISSRTNSGGFNEVAYGSVR
ncbi:Vld1p Ecym_1269 [Eremothecium cymbalariae DBVPG|uniref:DUF1746 domain-containing protein n=1 Tax=Eremothecium cymbalariae (strain CBS 270.75 / DBVPG 7215 / KCTC 17166 / NRRL Y-17582) TaxID=931890 RepID=G8JN46_ERECY|nr:hypothetical protein Ecym_1269 [Eremothecium cymbalariae DBVPG\